ncbi:MutS-like protein [Actinocorallia herbida]|uniref:MutS-like protein n=1 Tax=Actinocorallia herbida TaxID=58109 RepID=A0A3N1CT70_9ACTN|nr:DNA mismatch repair protein MutS [Actinocorallia herbida]ROO84512.1 MutS-like protein [Actinocorallia herbida]
MRPRLLAEDVDFSFVLPDDPVTADLVTDLELAVLWEGMARGDGRLRTIAAAVTLRPRTDPAALAYRQDVLADCLRNPDAVRALYDLAHEAVEEEDKVIRGIGGRSDGLLRRALRVLEAFCGRLRSLAALAAAHRKAFSSPAFTRLFTMLAANLDARYLREVEELLVLLEFEGGIAVTGGLGPGNRPAGFRLHPPPGARPDRRSRKARLRHKASGESDDDWRALASFRADLLGGAADAATASADDVRDFFAALRDELGFYVGCLNLAETLSAHGLPLCRPEHRPPGEGALSARGLYDPCLALRLDAPVTGNDLDADGIALVMVTGANRGGKSTFLRGLGVATLMAQSGMFAPAASYRATPADGVFTHFRREEDRTLTSGRLAEELGRLSAIADLLRPGSLLLSNESLSSTGEEEASAIAADLLRAFTAHGVRVALVTHLHALAHATHTAPPAPVLSLRAERTPDGARTFRLTPAPPSASAHATDLYRRILDR